jgi:hypothetical protein
MNKGRMPHRACGPFLLALLLCACGEQSRPSEQENAQLDEAEQMLEEADNTLADVEENRLDEAPDGASRDDPAASGD